MDFAVVRDDEEATQLTALYMTNISALVHLATATTQELTSEGALEKCLAFNAAISLQTSLAEVLLFDGAVFDCAGDVPHPEILAISKASQAICLVTHMLDSFGNDLTVQLHHADDNLMQKITPQEDQS